MTDQDKLRVMLGHWIAHSDEHASEYLRWAERAGKAAGAIRAAARQMHESGRHLAAALRQLGGPLPVEPGRGEGDPGGRDGGHGGHHDHGHDH